MRRLLPLCLLVLGCAGAWWWFLEKDDGYRSIEGEIFATSYRITYRQNGRPSSSTSAIRSAVETQLRRIDRIASGWKEDSEVSRYNRSQQKETFLLSAELKAMINRSREIEKMTGEAFKIDYEAGKLDLSAIAKGYAVDQIAAYFERELKIDSFLVEIGGEVKARGKNPKGEFWKVGIYIPDSHSSIHSPKVRLQNTSIATSGRYFKGNHIIDPATGKPSASSLLSTSVIAPSNTTADALATALHVMGPEAGPIWAREHHIHAIFILDDGTILKTP